MNIHALATLKQVAITALVALSLSACAGGGQVEYTGATSPESLLDKSSERVAFSLANESSILELTEWVNGDQPSRAELSCSGGDTCLEAIEVLEQFGIPYQSRMSATAAGPEVALFYDRVFTRDCSGDKNRFGCAVSANMVQMVADPQQLLEPSLLDLQDAERASGVYSKYLKGK